MSTREHGPLSRREIVGAGGASLAAAAAGPAFAQGEAPSTQATRLVDPQDKYPRPPFKRQSQPWPGLASRMDPRPDHGEKTYRGSGRLAGRKALVTGGDSGMGRAAAIAFAREGADVAINHLPEEEPDAREVIEVVRQEGRIGLSLPGDLRDEAFCKRLVDDALRGAAQEERRRSGKGVSLVLDDESSTATDELVEARLGAGQFGEGGVGADAHDQDIP